MKKLLVVALLLLPSLVDAGSSTITYTTPQSTYIRGTIIPAVNKHLCYSFLLPATCTTADVAAAGCVPKTVKGVTTDSCTIFASDAAGEQALLQEQSNKSLAALMSLYDNTVFRAACQGADIQTQNQLCSVLGLPAGCQACGE
jgi:hypothetical protein